MKLVVLGWWFKLAGKRWLGLQAHLPSSWLLPLAGSLCRLSLPHHQASPALDCLGSTHIALLCWPGLIDFRSFCYQNTKLHPLLWSAALGCEYWAGRCLGATCAELLPDSLFLVRKVMKATELTLPGAGCLFIPLGGGVSFAARFLLGSSAT